MDYVCDKPIFLQAVANASYKNYIINTLPDDIDINGSLDDELFDGLHAFDDLAQGLRDILKDNTVEDREYQRGVELAIALQDISYRVIAELREKNRQYHHINKMRLKESKVLS